MRRHIILTMGRSGSNSLRDMLNQNPRALNFGEVLGEWTPVRRLQRRLGLFRGSDAELLDRIYYGRSFFRGANLVRSAGRLRQGKPAQAKRFADIETVGIKDFSLNFERYGLLDYLETRPDIQVVGLVREGVADRMISNAMLGATGVIEMRGAETGGKRRLRIEPARIGEMLEVIERENLALDAMLTRLPEERVHVVRYHELFADEAARRRVMSGVFGFRGLPDMPTEARMSKIIRTPISETLENYADCLEAVRGTRYEAMLADA